MTIQQWLDNFGYAAVITLAKELEGQRIYIPVRAPLPAKLSSVLGEHPEALQEYRGDRIEIPRLKSVVAKHTMRFARAKAKKMIQKGLSVRFVSLTTGLAKSTIRNL